MIETSFDEASVESRCLHRLFTDLVASATKMNVRYYSDNVKSLGVLFTRKMLPHLLSQEDYDYHRLLRSILFIERAAGRPAITSALLYKPDSKRSYVGDPLGGQFFTVLEELDGKAIPKTLRTQRWITELNRTHAFWNSLSPAEVKRIMWEWARANIITQRKTP